MSARTSVNGRVKSLLTLIKTNIQKFLHIFSFKARKGITRPKVIKLLSAEHEISNAHKYEISRIQHFQAQISLECYSPVHKC